MVSRSQQLEAPRAAEWGSWLFAGIGALFAVVGCSGLIGSDSKLTFPIIGAATMLAWVAAFVWVRPKPLLGWAMAGSSLVLFVAGGAARVAMHTLGNLSSSRALFPDLLSLPGYLLLAIGLTLLASRVTSDRTVAVEVVLDAATCALGVLALVWVYLLGPALFSVHTSLHIRVILGIYPMLSVFVTAVMARLVFTLPLDGLVGCHQFMFASVCSLLCGDVLYTLADTRLVNLTGSWLDLPYALAFVASGAAVLHPSSGAASVSPSLSNHSRPSRARLVLIAAALSLPAFLLATSPLTHDKDTLVLSIILLALTFCAVLRVIGALRSNQEAREQLVHQATHDHLTGLPNRVVARAFIAERMADSHRRRGGVAAMFVDLDRFKLVNDSYGHSHGDQLLVAVANRLRSRLNARDLVARIGGDEFIVVGVDLDGTHEAMAIAERVCQALREPFAVNGNELIPGGSVGVSYSDDSTLATAETLMRDADTAMYEAKALGGDQAALFDTKVRARVSERLRVERDLRRAIDREELSLHYQPVVDLLRDEIVGFEALLRWTHPLEGNVPPDRFISIAEESGLIVPIGAWVIRQACQDLAQWRRTCPGWSQLHVSVNVSARQVQTGTLLDVISEELATAALPADALNVELTESMLIDDEAGMLLTLSALRKLGVRVSIDDFGTGYSSLAYLKRYPVDCVKIDKAFIEGLASEDTSEETLVSAIVAMSRALGLQTVAEGIELPAQRDRVIDLGCDIGQGWLWSPAVPAGEVPGLLGGSLLGQEKVGLTLR